MIYDGGSRSEAARVGSVSLQIVRGWVLRFNAEGPDGLKDRKSSGRPCKLNEGQRQALAQTVREGPGLEDHGVVRWRLQDLSGWICRDYGLTLSETTLSRELKKLGFIKLSARPRHAGQDPADLEDFKKDFPNNSARSKRKQAQNPTCNLGGAGSIPAAGTTLLLDLSRKFQNLLWEAFCFSTLCQHIVSKWAFL